MGSVGIVFSTAGDQLQPIRAPVIPMGTLLPEILMGTLLPVILMATLLTPYQAT